MRHAAGVGITCFALLVGCSADTNDRHGRSQPDGGSPVSTRPHDAGVASDDIVWAQQLLDKSATWPTVSREPVQPNPQAYFLCIAALTPEDLGPHNTPGYHVAVNPEARAGFASLPYRFEPDSAPAPFPVGTTIVKEKYADLDEAETRNRRDAVGVMIKREAGYNPEHGDWEYGYIDLDSQGAMLTIERGRLASCIDCHDNASARDYVYRTYRVDAPSD